MASWNQTIIKPNQRNNLSQKMLQSLMIRSRRSISYNNSNTITIYNSILENNKVKMKSLINTLGKPIFTRFVLHILNSPTTNFDQRASIDATFQEVLLEYDIENPIIPDTIQNQITEETLLSNVHHVYYCKCFPIGLYKYIHFINLRRNTYIYPGLIYKFDLSDESNQGTKLSFSFAKNKFNDVDTLTYSTDFSGATVPGTPGAYLLLKLTASIESYKLNIFDKNNQTFVHNRYFTYNRDYLPIKRDYPGEENLLAQFNYNNNVIRCISKFEFLRDLDINGLKYYFDDPNVDIAFLRNAIRDETRDDYEEIKAEYKLWFNDRYNPLRQYGLFYGTYHIKGIKSSNPFTILNRGKEHLISISGDQDKKSTYALDFIHFEDKTISHDYDFYYGDITIHVNGNFEYIDFYSLQYGINEMDQFFIFSPECYYTMSAEVYPSVPDTSQNLLNEDLNEQTNVTILKKTVEKSVDFVTYYEDLEGNTVQTFFQLHVPAGIIDNQADQLFLKVKSVIDDTFFQDQSMNTIEFKDVSQITENVVEYIDSTNHLNDVTYVTNENNSIELSIEIDSNNTIVIKHQDEVVNENNNLCLLKGYTYYFESNITSSKVLVVVDNTDSPVTMVNSNIYLPIISFNDNTTINEDKVYILNDGRYMFFGIPESNPITFIKSSQNDSFSFFGSSQNSITGIGPNVEFDTLDHIDNNTVYTYYYGTMIVDVSGDFGSVTIYSLYNGFLGGKNILRYNQSIENDASYSEPEVLNITPLTIDHYAFFNIVNINDNNSSSDNFSIIFTEEQMDILDTNMYPLNILDSIDESVTVPTYLLNNGSYVILNVPESHAITFTNKGKEHLFTFDGYFPYKKQSVGPGGYIYDYYWGNINIYVLGDFGKISIHHITKGYLNGKKLLMYSKDVPIGIAKTRNAIISAYPQLQGKTFNVIDDFERETFYITVYIVIVNPPFSKEYALFNFYGRDRNGEINSNSYNPELFFYIGDIVIFSIAYDNPEYEFDIYNGTSIVTDPFTIERTGTGLGSTVKWYPTIASDNTIFYRSNKFSHLMFNTIRVGRNVEIIDKLIPTIDTEFPKLNSFSVISESVLQNKDYLYLNMDISDDIVYDISTDIHIEGNTLVFLNDTTYSIVNNIPDDIPIGISGGIIESVDPGAIVEYNDELDISFIIGEFNVKVNGDVSDQYEIYTKINGNFYMTNNYIEINTNANNNFTVNFNDIQYTVSDAFIGFENTTVSNYQTIKQTYHNKHILLDSLSDTSYCLYHVPKKHSIVFIDNLYSELSISYEDTGNTDISSFPVTNADITFVNSTFTSYWGDEIPIYFDNSSHDKAFSMYANDIGFMNTEKNLSFFNLNVDKTGYVLFTPIDISQISLVFSNFMNIDQNTYDENNNLKKLYFISKIILMMNK